MKITQLNYKNNQMSNLYESYLYKNDKVLYGPIVSYWHSDQTQPKEVMAKMFLNLMDKPI